MEFPVHLIAGGSIVVASDVQIRDGYLCCLICGRLRGSTLNDAAHLVHQKIEESGGGQVVHGLAAVLVFFSILFIAVDSTALCCHAAEHHIDTQRDSLVRVQRSDQFGHLSAKLLTFRYGKFGNFVTDRVHDHTGMIVIFYNHGSQILFPPLAELLICIIIRVFVYQPVIAKFVHHIHTQLVTGG